MNKNCRMTGENHPRWKGGRSINKRGYVFISMPNHHRSNAGGYVFEHIVVMEKKLGRMIKPEDGHIHHKDKNKANNDPDNLELLSPQEHILLHLKERNMNRKPKRRKSKAKHLGRAGTLYTSGKSEKQKVESVPKEKLPRGYYYLKII